MAITLRDEALNGIKHLTGCPIPSSIAGLRAVYCMASVTLPSITRAEAQRIAANIAKLPVLLGRKD